MTVMRASSPHHNGEPDSPPNFLMFLTRIVTVFDGQVCLHFYRGRLKQVLEPGTHRMWGPHHVTATVWTMPITQFISTRDMMTSDGALVKVTALFAWSISDAKAAFDAGVISPFQHNISEYLMNPRDQSKADAEVALYRWVSTRTLEQVLAGRATVGEDILAELQPIYQAKGVTLTEVSLSDFALSGPLRQSMSELLKVEIDSQIALARARAEAATMRSLLNTARLVRDNPKLLELRMLSTGQKPRVTFLVNDQASSGPTTGPVLDDEANA